MATMNLVEFVTARLDEDEAAACAAAAANPGAPATHWSAEQVDHRSTTGLLGKAWAIVPERVKGATIATCPADAQPRRAEHIARHDPARALREVEAGRALIRLAQQAEEASRTSVGDDYLMAAQYLEMALKHRAAVYADHPDYQEDWRP